LAQRHLGRPVTWQLDEEVLSDHPETSAPAYYRVYSGSGLRLRERVIAGEGNPRDGWGWSFFYELKLGEGPEVSINSGSYDRAIDPKQFWIRFATPEETARLTTWLEDQGA
jgi:hypothetical protein